jgi:hypothetical protein
MTDETTSGMGAGFWIFALVVLVLIVVMCMRGGLGFGSGMSVPPNVATAGDVQRSTDFAALERQNNEGVAATRQGVYDVAAAVKDGNYDILGELRDLESASNAGFAQQQICCCETNRNIDSVRYDMSNFAAAIKENQTAGIQKVLEQLAANRYGDLERAYTQQYMQNAIQQAVCGIPKASPFAYQLAPAWGPAPNPGCGAYWGNAA